MWPGPGPRVGAGLLTAPSWRRAGGPGQEGGVPGSGVSPATLPAAPPGQRPGSSRDDGRVPLGGVDAAQARHHLKQGQRGHVHRLLQLRGAGASGISSRNAQAPSADPGPLSPRPAVPGVHASLAQHAAPRGEVSSAPAPRTPAGWTAGAAGPWSRVLCWPVPVSLAPCHPEGPCPEPSARPAPLPRDGARVWLGPSVSVLFPGGGLHTQPEV